MELKSGLGGGSGKNWTRMKQKWTLINDFSKKLR